MSEVFAKLKENATYTFQQIDGKEAGWKYGMCSDICSNPKITVYACCCPCLMNRDLAMHHKAEDGMMALLCGTPYSYVGWWCCEWPNMWAFRMTNREQTREQNGISKQDKFTDLVLSCTGCCAMVQEAKQNAESGTAPKQEPLMKV